MISRSLDELNKEAVTKVTSTDNAIVRFDGTTGEVQNSSVTIDDDDDVFNKIIISKTAVTDGSLVENGNVFSGSYLPVITNGVGISSSTPYDAHYIRCGEEVFVAGGFAITTNVSGSEALFECSLPIPSNLSAGRYCVGSFGSSENATYSNCTISGNNTTNMARFRCIPSVAGTITVYFTFQYNIN